mgnify:CR=1 FL=1
MFCFLFHLLYLLGPRVSEIATAHMNSIKSIRGHWWWQVTGKGNKTQLIPVNQALLGALIRYREFYGLSKFPQADEDHFLFMNLNGTKGVTSNMIYRLVKKVFMDLMRDLKLHFMKIEQSVIMNFQHAYFQCGSPVGLEIRSRHKG